MKSVKQQTHKCVTERLLLEVLTLTKRLKDYNSNSGFPASTELIHAAAQLSDACNSTVTTTTGEYGKSERERIRQWWRDSDNYNIPIDNFMMAGKRQQKAKELHRLMEKLNEKVEEAEKIGLNVEINANDGSSRTTRVITCHVSHTTTFI